MSILIRVVVPIVNILMRVELARIEVRNLIESLISSDLPEPLYRERLDMIRISCSTVWGHSAKEEAVVLLGASTVLPVKGLVVLFF